MARKQFRPIPPLTQKDIDRFWAKVDIRGPEECWPWTGSQIPGGYGLFSIKGRPYLSNRVAMFISTGVDAPDQLACHHCDNPPTT